MILYISIGVYKKEVAMKELSLYEQYEISGGAGLSTALLYLILGAGLYKILKSSKGRISIPRLIQLEWKN